MLEAESGFPDRNSVSQKVVSFNFVIFSMKFGLTFMYIKVRPNQIFNFFLIFMFGIVHYIKSKGQLKIQIRLEYLIGS